MSPVPHVIVCGAGLTGLTTAWHLRRAGVDVTVLEASDSIGGVMRTTSSDGYLVEHGPNSCLLTPELRTMLETLGLTPLLREAAPQAQRRFIIKHGRPLVVPTSPIGAIRSPLFSLGAKMRLLAEPFIAPRRSGGDETVAAFVKRRLGVEPLTWAVDPFVSGVYAGDPEQLSIAHAFPRLAALERDHGSIVRGMIAGARRSRRARHSAGDSRRPTMVSFLDGMGTLPHALAEDIGAANLLRGARVTSIEHCCGTVNVTAERHGATVTLSADAIVSTLPLHALTSVALPAPTRDALTQLGTVHYPSVVSMALGFRRTDVAHALDGFGCLIPSTEHRATLGVLFSSTLFTQRAPDGCVLLTCFLGGTRRPELGAASTASLIDMVLPELRELLGVSGPPRFVHRTTWHKAIPQYALGHGANAQAAEQLESLVPGLIVDGQFRRGVSVGDCVAAGAMIAHRAERLARARRERPAPERGLRDLPGHSAVRTPIHTPVHRPIGMI
jgi:protoporphyrinogen/coproporphyrinogen III oxidase